MTCSIRNKRGFIIICSLLILQVVITTGCKKEAPLEPSNIDENYLTVQDKPNDPIDHAIFQFYESTGIPLFYNDTISKKQIGDSAGTPRYFYIRLIPGYSPLGNEEIKLTFTQSKQQIPAFLDFFKSDIIPKLPADISIPSILFVDSFATYFPRAFMIPTDGWDNLQGFNTAVIKNKDVTAMTPEEKNMYVTSILTGFGAKKLILTQNIKLQKDFYSISRNLAKKLIADEIYTSYAVEFLFPPPIPAPEDLAFMHYVTFYLAFDGVEYTYLEAPREEDDLRMYLFAALYYTTEEFNSKYAAYPPILEKLKIMKEMASSIGFQVPN